MSTQLTLDFASGFDPATGLWRHEGPGHTRPVAGLASVHAGPEAAMRLLVAAEAGRLGEVDVSRVLAALRRTQVDSPGTQQRCFRWYMEETTVTDDHAAFFNSMALIALWRAYRNALDGAAQALVEALLRQMMPYALRRCRERRFYYPNEYLGYIVSA